MPHFNGLEALEIARKMKPEAPFIFVSGSIGEKTAIDSLEHGATDYILKDRMWRMVSAVRRALEEAQLRAERDVMKEELRKSRKLGVVATQAGGLVHDFRNLLQVLKLNIALLPNCASEPERLLKLAEQLDKATDRGCEMMRDFLVLAGTTEAKLVPVDFIEQIESTANLILPSLPPNVELHIGFAEGLPRVCADSGMVDRILLNLVKNAADAMPSGGKITITTDLVPAASLASGSRWPEEGSYLRVTVADTGSGMDEATRSRIFEPFFTTKKAGKGTGLGLAVAFNLMEAHDGFIDVQSELGVGTSFFLYFPVAQKTENAAPRNSPEELLAT